MDAEVDSAWICTQAVVSTDSQSDNEQEKITNYGCILLNDKIDNGRYVLKEGDNTIGRHPLNHIYIDHPSVSMNHAVIQCDSDGVVLLDKGSLNKTKLNKKTLRKDVAYFLEENALLVFGEVRANYFMHEGSNEFTNDTKSMATDNTSVHKATQNEWLSLSKLSNAVITPKSVSTDIPNAITDCNVSLVFENSYSCKIEKEVPKTITGTECAMNTLNDIHTRLNSSSPSDEYLLEALSQVEAKQNSNDIFHNLSNEDTPVMNLTECVPEITREDTPSPVMELKSSILTTSNVTKNQFQSPNKINTKVIRENTPSPVMDLKSSIITTNNIPTVIFQSPSQINTKLNREDTPSPIMDLGCYVDFENNLETINHGIISAIQSPNKVDDFDNTQVLEIDNNTVELYTQTLNNDNILFCKAQKVKSGKHSNTQIKNSSEIQSNKNLSNSKNTNLSTKCNVIPTNHFCGKNDNFNNDSATHGRNNDEHERIVNTFEADDDDVFRNFIENECKSQQHDLAILENKDFFNYPTQKISINKNLKSKLGSSIHDEETHRPPEFKKLKKTNTITSEIYSTNIHEENTQIPETDDDFFSCPTQKLSITKKIQPKPKVSSSIHDEETQELLEFSKPYKTNSILSKSYSANIHEENTQIPEMDDDFFNCPTQKVSITKKIQPKPKVSSSIHEEETQIPLELKQLNKTDTITSKNYNINIHEENTQIPEMDDDFFNCPTQKVSITKKIQPKPKLSSSIHEEETQIPLELKQLNKTNTITSKNYSTNVHDENTQVPETDDDFFSCPTQKLSTTKKIQPKPKVSSSIHDEETQELLEFSKPYKTNSILSKSYSASIHEENTQIPEMDDDFFNCPTQKVSITKKIQPKPKVSSSIHDEETQELLEFSKPCKTDSIFSKSYSASIHEENTQIPEMDEDFCNCPIQKVSISKKTQLKPKVSSSIHKEETQIPLELKQLNKTDTITSEIYSTNIHEENTQIPEMDDDFFNCPTQKVSITKKIQPKPKLSSSIHEEETQIPLELKQLNKTDTITSEIYSTNIHEENTQIPEMDDDFFNCPTQKVSITKKIQPKPKVSSSIHEEETQIPLELKQLNKTDTITSKNYNINIHEENTQIPEMDDDFFNCPTQKVSITKKIQPKPKLSSSIHEEETQIPLELKQLNKTDTITSKNYNINIHEENTQIPEMDDDFFNCPTQKVSTTKMIQPKPKVYSSIHDEETQELLEFSKPCKTDSILSKNYSTSKHEENTQIPKIDDDFFNCPTQKLSTTKKIQPKPKVSSSIHEKETQIPLELKQLNKTDTFTSEIYSTNIHEENTQIPEMDDDFFNCPTQKVSITKKIQPKPKVSSSIHEKETQIPLELKQLNKTDTITSEIYSTNIHEENTQIPEMDDDFFNCPTQKVSTTKMIQPKPKVSSSIHDEETQELLEFSKPCKTDSILSKNYSTSKHEENTQIPKIDDDFFNCPTQKLSTTKKIQPKPKVSSSIHEKETQIPLELKQLNKIDTITSEIYSTNIHEENTQIPEMDDDFFNCPTQKVSTTKMIQPKPKVSSTIQKEDIQKPPEFSQFGKTNNITSNTNSANIHGDLTSVFKEQNDDFFNCFTQKVIFTKKLNPKLEESSTVHKEGTQELLEFHKPIKSIASSFKSCTTSKQENSTEIPEIDDDFFNCPTQKIAVTKKIDQLPNLCSTKHEENTQKPLEFTQLNKTNINTSKTDSINKHNDSIGGFKIDDKDFFNCSTQQLSCNRNSKTSMGCKKHESVPTIINEAETQDSSMQSISKISLCSNIKQNKGNIVNYITQKVQSNSISNCSINSNEGVTMNPEHFDRSNNHKQIVEHDKEDRCKVQKSKCIKSNTIRRSNVQLPVNCKEKSPNTLKINKPKIRVREDLHMFYSGDSSNNFTNILNKPNENAVLNNINTRVPFDKNIDSPCCSNTTTIKENDLNTSSSTKQKHLTDDSVQSQASVSLKYKHQMKRMDESIFSPLNIPDVSANSLLEHHSSPKTAENKLNTLNCEPSTSSNDAFKWKSFWNKKKVQSQDKGISDKQKSIKIATEVKENKERYQTRAITRKRKQNGVVESNKKICSRNKILEPLVENSSEIVVSFSYLKSRHLQEMKQFVDKTGGTVTDEITQCSVLVTDKIRCTMKILSAIARGCPIVNANWLKHSYTVKMFQDFDDFIIVDKDAERKYKFQLKESLAKAKAKRLLDGYNVLVTPSVKPGPQEMKVIITCAGGNYVLNWTSTQYSKKLIVTCDKDRTRWKSAWDNEFAKIIDSDTLVMSIIRQKLTI